MRDKSFAIKNNLVLFKAIQISSGGISGGISSTIAGGNFWKGVKQGLITTGINHLAHKTADWMTAEMELKQVRQDESYDCVLACSESAADKLGITFSKNSKEYERVLNVAKKNNGVPANSMKRALTYLGFNVETFNNPLAKLKVYHEDGISPSLKSKAIQFIVESIYKGSPVLLLLLLLSFQDSSMPNSQGHASLVTKIKFKSDYTDFRRINLMNPGSSVGEIVSFQDTYGFSEAVYGIFSLRKR